MKLIIVFTVLSCLSACSLLGQGDSKDKQVKVSSQFIPLLAVPSELQQRVWLEKFTFSLNSHVGNKSADNYAKQSMLLQTELNAQGINIAAMSFDGIPLAQASWNSGGQKVTSELSVAKNFDAKQVLHDLQIVNWPINSLAPALAKSFSVDEQLSTDANTGKKTKTRRFYHQGEVIIIIRYQAQEISFEQLNAGYSLTITRLSDDNLTSKN